MADYLDPSINRPEVQLAFDGTFSGPYFGRKADFMVVDMDTGLVTVGGHQQAYSIPGFYWSVPWPYAWSSILTTIPTPPSISIWWENGAAPSSEFPYDVIPTPDPDKEYWFVYCNNGFGTADTQYASRDKLEDFDETVSGTWGFEADAKEILHPYFMTDGVGGADGSPTYGGAQTEDIIPRAQGQHFYLLVRADGNIKATATLNLDGADWSSATVTATADGAADLDTPLYHYPTGKILVYTVNHPSINEIVFNGMGAHCVDDEDDSSSTGDNDQTFQRIIAVVGGDDAGLQVICNTYDPPDDVVGELPHDRGEVTACGFLTIEKQDDLTIVGKAYMMTSDYPSSITATYEDKLGSTADLALNPSGSHTFYRRSYGSDCRGAIDGGDWEYLTGRSADEKAPIKAWLKGSSLTALGEDTRDWRVLWRCHRYNAWTLLQDESIDIGGGSGATRAWGGSPGNWEGYRYLKVRVKAASSGTQDLTVACDASPDKTYTVSVNFAASNTYQYVWVDLCYPDGATDPYEVHDTRYYLDTDGLPVTDLDYWGIGRITGLAITGTSITVDTIDLAWYSDTIDASNADYPTISFLPAFLDWEEVQEGGDVVEGSRGIVGETNGRRNCIIAIASRQLFSDGLGGTFWVYSQRTIDSAKADLIATPGWNLTDVFSPETDDGWHRTGGTGSHSYGSLALWLQGGGVLIDYFGGDFGDTVEWANWVGRDIHSSVSIEAQSLCDELIIWPQAGDVFQKGATGGATTIGFAKILRAGGDGISEKLRTNTDKVFFREVPDVAAGDDSPDIVGRYATGNPFARMDELLTPDARTFVSRFRSTDAEHDPGRSRRWYRTVWNIAAGLAAGISYDVTFGQRHYRAFIGASGNIFVGYSDNTLGTWTDTDTGIAGTFPTFRIDRTTRAQTQSLVCLVSGDVKLYTRTGDTDSFTLATTIDTGDGPTASVQGRNGLLYVYWLDGTDVKGQILDRALAVVEATFTVVGSAEATGLAVDESVINQTSHRLVLHYYTGGTLTILTSTDGKTFS